MGSYKPEGLLIDTAENRLAIRSAAALHDAFLRGTILEAKAVLCDCGHNLIVNLGSMKGIIPRSEGALGIEDGSVRDIALISRVNKPVCFRVTGFEKDEVGNMTALLSRRAVQAEYRAHLAGKLKPGDILPACVTHLESFGAFVDIGCGIPSLLPIDAISISRISHPKDRFYCGQYINVAIKQIDENMRIYVTHKELLGTWAENAARFRPGETVSSVIRSVESYGVFVELSPNLAGLAEPHVRAGVGQSASVYIKSIIPEKMKIKLILVDCDRTAPPSYHYDYFVTGGHISRWVYSPPSSEKVIETVFDERE